ncbi:hypothetical protein GW590_12785 [Rahnella sp. SAP-1]|uniref:Dermonecrotic toxin N-terminal domain-containing protein n=1 Tax=Rouxiella aceris TaxID=2703884 RepID=A0A848MKD0_9GAMM|nr:DUF6543 domain-containing protein [Rouxiella aceris]NMP27733.1 hypothetical protein [Rouxiella aceris]
MNNINISLSGNPIPAQNTADNQATPRRPFKVISKAMASNHSVADVAGKFKSAETPRQLARALGHEELIKLGYPQADADKSYLLAIAPHSGEKTVLSLTDMLLLNTQKNKSWLDSSTAPTEKIVLLDSKGQVTGTGCPLSPETWRTIIWQVDFKGYYLQHLQQKTATPGYQQDKAFLNKAALIKTYKLAYQGGKLSDSAMQLAARAAGLPEERVGDAASWSSLTASRIKSARPDASVDIGMVSINGKASTDLMTFRDKKSGQLLLWKPGSSPPLIEFSSAQKLREYLLRHADSPQKMQALLSHFSRKDTRTDHPFRDFVMAYGVELALAKMRKGELDLQISLGLTTKQQHDPFAEMARRQTARLKSDADTLIVSDADAGERSIKQRLSDINTLMLLFAPLAAVVPPLAAATNAALLTSGLTQAGVGGYDIAQGNISEGLLEMADGGINIALSAIAAASDAKGLSAPSRKTEEMAAPPSNTDNIAPSRPAADSAAVPAAAKNQPKPLRPSREQLSAKHYREIEITDTGGGKSLGYVPLCNDEIKTIYRFDADSGNFHQTGQSVDAEGRIIGLAGGVRPDIVAWVAEHWAATTGAGRSVSARIRALLEHEERPAGLSGPQLHSALMQLPAGEAPEVTQGTVQHILGQSHVLARPEVIAWVCEHWASTAIAGRLAGARVAMLLKRADKPVLLRGTELHQALTQLPPMERPGISLQTIHKVIAQLQAEARPQVTAWVGEHWASTTAAGRSAATRIEALFAREDRPRDIAGPELYRALMQLPPSVRPVISLGAVQNTLAQLNVQARPQVIAWVQQHWAATAAAGRSATTRLATLLARADRPEGLSGAELHHALGQLPLAERATVGLGTVKNALARSNIHARQEVVNWVRQHWAATAARPVPARIEALLARADKPEGLSSLELHHALLQLPEAEKQGVNLKTVQNALAQSNVQVRAEVLAWVREHWPSTAAPARSVPARIESLLNQVDRPDWISAPELHNALTQLPESETPKLKLGMVQIALAQINVQPRPEVVAWVADRWAATAARGRSTVARIEVLLAREDRPARLSGTELHNALMQLPKKTRPVIGVGTVKNALALANAQASPEVVDWVRRNWASTTSVGPSVGARIEVLLSRTDKPTALSGPQLHHALMQLPPNEKPQVSASTVQIALARSNAAPRAEVVAWIRKHWDSTAATSSSATTEPTVEARINLLLTRPDRPSGLSGTELHNALMQLPQGERLPLSQVSDHHAVGAAVPAAQANQEMGTRRSSGGDSPQPGPAAKRLRAENPGSDK